MDALVEEVGDLATAFARQHRMELSRREGQPIAADAALWRITVNQ
jgi:hypothetical protein